jgi:hypothetical protein
MYSLHKGMSEQILDHESELIALAGGPITLNVIEDRRLQAKTAPKK